MTQPGKVTNKSMKFPAQKPVVKGIYDNLFSQHPQPLPRLPSVRGGAIVPLPQVNRRRLAGKHAPAGIPAPVR